MAARLRRHAATVGASANRGSGAAGAGWRRECDASRPHSDASADRGSERAEESGGGGADAARRRKKGRKHAGGAAGREAPATRPAPPAAPGGNHARREGKSAGEKRASAHDHQQPRDQQPPRERTPPLPSGGRVSCYPDRPRFDPDITTPNHCPAEVVTLREKRPRVNPLPSLLP